MNFFKSKNCQRCGHLRKPGDKGPLHLCPRCGADLLMSANERKRLEDQARVNEENNREKLEKISAVRKSGKLTLSTLMSHFLGETVGINILDPGKVDSATLIEVQDDHFTIEAKALHFHVPFNQVIRVVTSPKGAVNTGLFSVDYPLVIKVFDFVIYKGAIGVGFSMPLDTE